MPGADAGHRRSPHQPSPPSHPAHPPLVSLRSLAPPYAEAKGAELLKYLPPTLYGPVAQGLEQSAHNRSVGGSIPSGPTIYRRRRTDLHAGNTPLSDTIL